ncbi:hypothetical protein D3C83_216340 [compost metagenome]
MGPAVESREFLKVPRCTVCGDVVPKAKPRPVEAEPAEAIAEPKAEEVETEAEEAELSAPAKDVA